MQKIKQLLALSVIAAGFAAYVLAFNLFSDPFHNSGFTMDSDIEVISNVVIVIMAVLIYALSMLHGRVLWYFWLRFAKVDLTVPQQQWRYRIMARAFIVVIVGFFPAISVFNTIAVYAPDVRSAIATRLGWIFFLGILALPSVVASFSKPAVSK